MSAANPLRGEAALVLGGVTLVVRPSYARLVAAEAELGPLFALIEAVAEGRLRLDQMVGLLWHCLDAPPPALTRARFGDQLVEAGLAQATPVVRLLIEQLLGGVQPGAADGV